MWENIGPDGTATEARTSLAHGWASGPTPILTGYVLGVQPAKPGYQTFTVDAASRQPAMGRGRGPDTVRADPRPVDQGRSPVLADGRGTGPDHGLHRPAGRAPRQAGRRSARDRAHLRRLTPGPRRSGGSARTRPDLLLRIAGRGGHGVNPVVRAAEPRRRPMLIAGRRIEGIGLGTAQFAFRDGTVADSVATVHAALDAGVRLIDTALAYTRPGIESYAEQVDRARPARPGDTGPPAGRDEGRPQAQGRQLPGGTGGRKPSARQCEISLRTLEADRIDLLPAAPRRPSGTTGRTASVLSGSCGRKARSQLSGCPT